VGRTLYQRESSPECRAARWVLERKGLDYTAVEAVEAVVDGLRQRHGAAELPLLEDGDAAVAGLRAMVSYLERSYGSPSVFPVDPQKRNQAVTLAEFAEGALGEIIRRLGGESSGREAALAELRALLGQVREAIARRALDSGARHLGDLAVAAELVSCGEIPELEFDQDYADLSAYVARVRAGLGGG
jgi:glutathione S-transferase